MLRNPLHFLSTMIMLGILSGFSLRTNDNTNEGIGIGQKAPLADVSMKGTDDQTYTLNGLKKAKGLVVIFSCNTCPFVVGSENFAGWEKQYNQLFENASSMNYGFVLVNSNEAKRQGDDSIEAMKKHALDLGYKMPYVVDEKSALANAFGAKTTPHVYCFNENMELIYQGAIDNTVDAKRTQDENYLLNAMKEHASGTAVNKNTTPPRGCSIKRVS